MQIPKGLAHSQAIGHAALRQYADYHLDHLGPYFPAVSGHGKPAIIPRVQSSTFKDFVLDLKAVLDKQPLPERAFDWIFSPHQILNKPHPNCGGEQDAGWLHTALLTGSVPQYRNFIMPDCRFLAGVWRLGRENIECGSRVQKEQL